MSLKRVLRRKERYIKTGTGISSEYAYALSCNELDLKPRKHKATACLRRRSLSEPKTDARLNEKDARPQAFQASLLTIVDPDCISYKALCHNIMNPKETVVLA